MTTIDFGLEPDVCKQWQKKDLLDYTIQVEDREFKVHKDVLISISDYFKAMLCGSMKESVMDRVALPGLSAETVSKILELIYTGQRSIVTDNVAEILPCAMYLQMPRVIKVCTQVMLERLTIKNCMDTLLTFVTYALSEAVEEGRRFLRSESKAVLEYYKRDELAIDAMQHIVGGWGRSEWELFLYIKSWVEADVENRSLYIDSLMSQVRFPLMTCAKMKEIRDMDLFKNSDGSWCEILNKAAEYHKLPIYQKIANTSVQTKNRSDPLPLIVLTPEYEHDVGPLYAVQPDNTWAEHNAYQAPTFVSGDPFVIEVNDFLIVCSGLDKQFRWDLEVDTQRWDIFDPRTMAWFPMAAMHTSKSAFAMVFHNGKLFAIGGETRSDSRVESLTDGVEEYSFETGTWRVAKKLPFAVSRHAAVVYDGSVYILGGDRNDRGKCTRSKDLDLVDLANGTSEKKAGMPKTVCEPQMFVMTLRNKKVIVVNDLNDFKVRCYNPQNNQWFAFRPKITSARNFGLQWRGEATLMARGNTMYFLNCEAIDKKTRDWCFFHQDSVKWEFSKTETAVTETYLQLFPKQRELIRDAVDAFGAVLSLNITDHLGTRNRYPASLRLYCQHR